MRLSRDLEQIYDIERMRRDIRNSVLDFLKKRNASNKKKFHILVQLPDGLRTLIRIIQKEIEDLFNELHHDVEIYFYLDANYGACDLVSMPIDFDLILHFGHSRYFSSAQSNDIHLNYLKEFKKHL